MVDLAGFVLNAAVMIGEGLGCDELPHTVSSSFSWSSSFSM